MCGRYAVTLPPEAMADLFRTLNTLDFPPRHNIAPTQPIVAILEEHGRRVAKLVRWGLVPSWVKDPREFPLIINARVETMADKPAFRTALRNQRCIVPASGYYEWHTGPDKTKQPYYITHADGRPMAFAGLYSTWVGPDGEEIDTAATITVAANPDLAHIHDRMPAVLQGEAIDDWLDTGRVNARAAAPLACPLPTGAVRYHKVDKAIGSSKSEGPHLIAPLLEPARSEPPDREAEAETVGDARQMQLF